jgi:exodeoxyribonuclease-1
MAANFFFYDLETSGFNPRAARIMQFAGQRTDMNLQPIGDPVDALIKLTPDVLPDPDAIFVTGITPQKTLQEGLTEAEFLQQFNQTIATPETIFVGYNSIRFDDEFMRFTLYRNFYDPYEWQWANGASRWDILDVVRMTRALRPDGITWPSSPDGKPTNRLELLTKANGLDHEHAHDALNDVMATIAVAKLIKDKQSDLFEYLLSHRSKKAVRDLLGTGQPFAYASGRYPGANQHATAAVQLALNTDTSSALVYDLRYDPTPFFAMSIDELAKAWEYSKDPDAIRVPVKSLKFNHCPAIAPLGVIKDQATQQRIGLRLDEVAKNFSLFKKGHQAFAAKMLEVVAKKDEQRARDQIAQLKTELNVDAQLYDELPNSSDKPTIPAIRAAKPQDFEAFASILKDERLQQLLPLYKARNYPSTLTGEERQAWEAFCKHQLFDGGQQSKAASYFNRLQSLSQQTTLSSTQQYLLEELQLYGQSILPADVTD